MSAEPHSEALYHVQFGVVQPSRGDVLHKVAAYNSASRVTGLDGTLYDFSRKADEHVGGCIMLPPGVPPEYADPDVLWSAAQDAETRVDGQPARLIEIAIPRDVPADRRLDFACAVVQPWVAEGAAAQIDIHCPRAADGGEQPHAHVILSRRALGADGFTDKKLPNAPWTADRGRAMRCVVAERMNQWLAENGIDVRVDHRSHRERGDHTPTEKSVSRAAVETWKRRPDDATAFADVIAARPVRRQLRAERRELAAAEAEVADLRREYSRRVPGLQGPRHRRRAALEAAWLPPVGDGVAAVEPQPWGATITLAEGSVVVARADRIVIRGPVTDAAIAALADQAVRQGWTDGVELTGNKAFRDRLAAALAVRGVTVINHPEPPSVVAVEAARRHFDGPVVSSGDDATARRPGDLTMSADQHPPTSRPDDLNMPSSADTTASPAADPTPSKPQENRRLPAGSTAPTSADALTRRNGELNRSPDAGAPGRRHVEVTKPSPQQATARRPAGDRRRALAALSKSEQRANSDYAAGRITAAQLQTARRPSAAVAAGDRATIEAAARGDLDEAQRAAEQWQARRDQRAAVAARRAASAPELTPANPAHAPAYRPSWAQGPRKPEDKKDGRRA